jgi:putative hydrolase of the HAD superfamily
VIEPSPEVLVADLGGVLCRWLPDRRIHALAALSGLPAATVDELVFTSGFDDAADRGRFDLAAFTAELRSLLVLGPDVDDDAVRAAWATAYEPDTRVLDLVERTTRPTAVFTNNGPLLEAALGRELAAVGEVFDRVVCSWHLGATKPDPAAYAGAVEALGVHPSVVLFVDDSDDNVVAARAAGWQAHHYTDPLNLTATLRGAGLLAT